MAKPKVKTPRLKLEMGQTIVLVKDKITNRGKNTRQVLGEWDVVRINKKNIVLQNWPAYEHLVIKFWR